VDWRIDRLSENVERIYLAQDMVQRRYLINMVMCHEFRNIHGLS
jgi:hypothetical protein